LPNGIAGRLWVLSKKKRNFDKNKNLNQATLPNVKNNYLRQTAIKKS